jgi:hypothetical protein
MFVLFYRNTVIVSQPPVFCTRNPREQLHNTDQAAVQFGDGFAMHFVHGIYFTQEEFDQYILSTPTMAEINAIENVEQRTAVLLVQLETVLRTDPSVQLLAKDTETAQIEGERPKILHRELYSFQYLDEERRAVLLHCHSVEKPNIHLVPVSCQTPAEAVAWMNHGISEFVYQT